MQNPLRIRAAGVSKTLLRPNLRSSTNYLKATLTFFLTACMMFGCSKEKAADPAEQKVQWLAPAHPSLEIYITKQSVSAPVEMTLRPDLKLWRPDSKGIWFGGSTGGARKERYAVNLQYKGTNNKEDHYAVSISHPTEGELRSFTMEVTFTGTDKELWKDSDYRIGFRPETGDTPQ